MLIGVAAGDAKKVHPVFFFAIGIGHTSHVAGMPAVAAAKIDRSGFHQQHTRTALARAERRAKSGVPPADYEHIVYELFVDQSLPL